MVKVDKNLVGKRVLYRKRVLWTDIEEGNIQEISPSGTYVKIDTPEGERWCEIETIEVLEILELKKSEEMVE